MISPDGGMHLARWLGLAILLAGVAVLAGVAAHPRPDRVPFEFGLLYAVSRFDQALPLVGIGLALGRAAPRPRLLTAALFLAGIPLGGFVANWIAAAIAAGFDLVDSLFLMTPGCCLLAGMALASPCFLRPFTLPPACIACGIALGLVFNFDDPSAAEQAFAAGAALAGAWLTFAPMLLWIGFERQWFRIAAPILGSWLIAIGAMLAALHLLAPEIPADRSGAQPAAREARVASAL